MELEPEFSLSDELKKNREKRAAAFNIQWPGPISYESIGYFSIFPVLISSCFVSYKLILAPWITVMTVCTIWTVTYMIWLPFPSPSIVDNLKGLDVLISMMGGAITFLLAFRLARAAVRFYDARAAAGKMVEICRVVGGEVLIAAPHRCRQLLWQRDNFLRWTVAFPVAVKNLLRVESNSRNAELAGVLSDEDAAQLLASSHQPLHCLHMMRMSACQISLCSPFEPTLAAAMHRDVSASLATLTGAMGAMERINGTPLPFAYTAHVRLFLVTYLCFVAAVLLPTCGWLTVPAMALLSFVLLGTETAATECERPFQCRADHLPLERYCLTVSDNVAQLAAMPPPPSPPPSKRPSIVTLPVADRE